MLDVLLLILFLMVLYLGIMVVTPLFLVTLALVLQVFTWDFWKWLGKDLWESFGEMGGVVKGFSPVIGLYLCVFLIAELIPDNPHAYWPEDYLEPWCIYDTNEDGVADTAQTMMFGPVPGAVTPMWRDVSTREIEWYNQQFKGH